MQKEMLLETMKSGASLCLFSFNITCCSQLYTMKYKGPKFYESTLHNLTFLFLTCFFKMANL